MFCKNAFHSCAGPARFSVIDSIGLIHNRVTGGSANRLGHCAVRRMEQRLWVTVRTRLTTIYTA